MLTIDLNSDLGESFGRYTLGNDSALIPLISSANIACGYHAGDPNTMFKTVRLAEKSGVGVGAHPSFPDLNGFGRRYMSMQLEDVTHMIIYQIAALLGFTKNHRLHHVKPHGALYNAAGKNLKLAMAICKGIKFVDPDIRVYGLSNSCLIQAAKNLKLPFVQEVFADRNYEEDGSLVPRTQQKAVLTDPDFIAKRAVNMIKTKSVISITGKKVPLAVDSICVHGDNQKALFIVKKIITNLKQNKIIMKKS